MAPSGRSAVVNSWNVARRPAWRRSGSMGSVARARSRSTRAAPAAASGPSACSTRRRGRMIRSPGRWSGCSTASGMT